MASNTITSDFFTPGDDTYIITPGVPRTLFDPADNANKVVVTSFGPVDTLSGDDIIAVYGGFIVESLICTPADHEAEVAIEDLSFVNLIGLRFQGDLDMGEVPPDADADHLSDDDTLIALVELVEPPHAGYGARLTGLSAPGYAIRTGYGNDIVVGGALGYGAISAIGISASGIFGGDGNNIVVGLAANIGGSPSGEVSVIGLEVEEIVTGIDSDIIVGAAASVVGAEQNTTAYGMNVGSIFATNRKVSPDVPDVILGIAAVIEDNAEFGSADGSSMSGAGIITNLIFTGNGDDIIGGVAIAELGAFASVQGTRGLESNNILTGSGSATIFGVVYAEVGELSVLQENAGLLVGDLVTGDDNDLIVGAFLAEIEAETGLGTSFNSGISGLMSRQVSSISTSGGDDIVIGIADVSTGGGGNPLVESVGIYRIAVDTGADNDIVIGLGGSWALDEPETGSFGIVGTPTPPAPPPEDQELVAQVIDVNLGEGDDFLFTRGASGGIRDALVLGGGGNDVFDIHGGTGVIDGGADYDTLILSGDRDDYRIYNASVISVGSDAEITENTFEIIGPERENFTTILLVGDIELFVFDDGAYTVEQLDPIDL